MFLVQITPRGCLRSFRWMGAAIPTGSCGLWIEVVDLVFIVNGESDVVIGGFGSDRDDDGQVFAGPVIRAQSDHELGIRPVRVRSRLGTADGHLGHATRRAEAAAVYGNECARAAIGWN